VMRTLSSIVASMNMIGLKVNPEAYSVAFGKISDVP
jgi:hypothetical protein